MKKRNNLFEGLKGLKGGTLLLYILIFLLGAMILGTLLRFVLENLNALISGGPWHFRAAMLAEWTTWLLGLVICAVALLLYIIGGGFQRNGRLGRRLLGGSANKNIMEESPLENSRFLTDAERDKYFPPFTYNTLEEMKNDGVPVRAVMNKKGMLEGNFKSGVHALVIGATGSGKTTTFINPMIQLIAATNCGSSMIMTDPKGELFDLHSKFLKDRGYNVMVLDLRDT